MTIDSYFWDGVPLSGDVLEDVRVLMKGASPDGETIAAYERLLEAGPIARGYAMDCFSRDHAQHRHGDPSGLVLKAIGELVRQCARDELRAPPLHVEEPEAMFPVGANHGSALTVLGYGARCSDAAMVAKALRENEDPVVLDAGARTAGAIIAACPDALTELSEPLAHLVRETSPPELAATVVEALGGSRSEAVVPLLLKALCTTGIEPSATAARVLLERDFSRFRDAVAKVASEWSVADYPPFNVAEVRQLLGARSH
jgi:hypothetical protein